MNKTTKDVYIDADSILYQCAGVQDNSFYTLKHTKSGNSKKFKNKKEVVEWIDNWVGDNPDKRSKEDFIIEKCKELSGSIESAINLFRVKVRSITDGISAVYNIGSVFICLQGSTNFRKDLLSKWTVYKANRVEEKPLLFSSLHKSVIDSWGMQCIVSDYEETDDVVVRAGNAGNVVAFIDKDIVANTVGDLYNYNSGELFYNSDESRWRMFCTQMLIGDNSDNICGIGHLGESTKQFYGVSNRGCGKVTAEKILSSVSSEKEAWVSIIAAYSDSHPDDWADRMRETSTFLWMCRTKGEKFSLDTYLSKFDIHLNNRTERGQGGEQSSVC